MYVSLKLHIKRVEGGSTKVPEVSREPSKCRQVLPNDLLSDVQGLAVGARDGALAQAVDKVDERGLLLVRRLPCDVEDGAVRVPEKVFEVRG